MLKTFRGLAEQPEQDEEGKDGSITSLIYENKPNNLPSQPTTILDENPIPNLTIDASHKES